MRISSVLIVISACVINGFKCHKQSPAVVRQHLRTAHLQHEPERTMATTCDNSCEFANDGVCDDGTMYSGSSYYNSADPAADDANDKGDTTYYPNAGTTYGDSAEEDGFYESNPTTTDKVFACRVGTDCTDCGGEITAKPSIVCENTCVYRRDGVCDDTRGLGYCALGTDCQDCGPLGASNFTSFETNRNDTSDDDDDYWTFNDGSFIDSPPGLSFPERGERWRKAARDRDKPDHIDGNTLAFYLALVLIVSLAAVPMVHCAHQLDNSVAERANGNAADDDIHIEAPRVSSGVIDCYQPPVAFVYSAGAPVPLPLPVGVTAARELELAQVVLRDPQSVGVPVGASVAAVIVAAAPGCAPVLY